MKAVILGATERHRTRARAADGRARRRALPARARRRGAGRAAPPTCKARDPAHARRRQRALRSGRRPTVRGRARRRRRGARRLRHGHRDGRRCSPRRTRSRPTSSWRGALADRRTSPTPSCSASTRASACWRAAAARSCVLSLGGGRSRPQAGGPLRRGQGGAGAPTSRARPQVPRRRAAVVICVKPGFVKTGMTAGLKPPPFAGEPDGVARQIVRAIDRGKPVVYAPRRGRS